MQALGIWHWLRRGALQKVGGAGVEGFLLLALVLFALAPPHFVVPSELLPPEFSDVPVEQVGAAADAFKAVAYRKLVKLNIGVEFWDTRTEKAALKFLLATERTGGP